MVYTERLRCVHSRNLSVCVYAGCLPRSSHISRIYPFPTSMLLRIFPHASQAQPLRRIAACFRCGNAVTRDERGFVLLTLTIFAILARHSHKATLAWISDPNHDAQAATSSGTARTAETDE